eukprot:125388_1
MKPEDILWNGEALLSTNCDYKLALLNGSLVILNGSNDAIWTANATASGERNMVLYSYSSGNDRVWDTDTSTLLQSSIVYADRAILNTKGQFFIIDNATLQEHYKVLPTNQSFDNEIRTARDTNMDCLSTRYDYVDKRNGFYASWVSYYNCGDNMYNKSTTTPCIAYVYCEEVRHYENMFLLPVSSQTNCRKYAQDYWREIKNNYLLFQVSIANTQKKLDPQLFIVLSTSNTLRFSQEFDSSDEVTLKITVMPNREGDKINLTVNGYHQMISNTSDLFTESIEWIWIEWDINFDYIRIGNAQYIGRKQLYEPKYSLFFEPQVKANKYLFNYYNLAWTAYRGKCYGQIVVQFPPLSKQTPKGCYENYTHVFAQPEPADGNTMNLFIEYPSPGTPSPVVTITSTAMETTITSDHETSQSNETIIGSETITETETDKEESGEGGGAKTDDGTGAAVGISVGAVALIGLAGYRVYKVRKGQNTAVDSDNGHNEVELANAIAPAAAVQTAETTEADDDDLVHL